MDKKKLLIYAHYYVPDTASTGQILRELAEGLSDRFYITVICVVPSYLGTIEERYQTQKYYEEIINGIRVLRIRVPEFHKADKMSRIKNILSYFFGAICATFHIGSADYVYAISQPPILGGLLGVCGKWIKHAKYIYNIQDFNPEQTMAVGYVKNKLILKGMMLLDKFSCKKADKVIVVGRDMTETLKKRFGKKNPPPHAQINNWIDEKAIYPLPPTHPKVLSWKEKHNLTDCFVIMYSGNIGLYYDLENLIRVIERIPDTTQTPDGRRVVFAFVGGGSVLDTLKAYVQDHAMHHVVFIPYQDKRDLIYSLNAGDVHWCVNAQGIKGVSVPSKCYGIMSAGKPILGVLEKGSEARCLIEDAQCGLCADPCDYDTVEDLILQMIDQADGEALTQMGLRGREDIVKHLTKAHSIQRYEEEILSI